MLKIIMIALLLFIAVPQPQAKPGDVVGFFAYSAMATWLWCTPVKQNNMYAIRISASLFTISSLVHFAGLCIGE